VRRDRLQFIIRQRFDHDPRVEWYALRWHLRPPYWQFSQGHAQWRKPISVVVLVARASPISSIARQARRTKRMDRMRTIHNSSGTGAFSDPRLRHWIRLLCVCGDGRRRRHGGYSNDNRLCSQQRSSVNTKDSAGLIWRHSINN
jgi:hypothetical protein